MDVFLWRIVPHLSQLLVYDILWFGKVSLLSLSQSYIPVFHPFLCSLMRTQVIELRGHSESRMTTSFDLYLDSFQRRSHSHELGWGLRYVSFWKTQFHLLYLLLMTQLTQLRSLVYLLFLHLITVPRRPGLCPLLCDSSTGFVDLGPLSTFYPWASGLPLAVPMLWMGGENRPSADCREINVF